MMTLEKELEWLQARRTGIGGSDAAAVLGLSKWKTPLQVYLEKVGELPPEPENKAMRWGKALEPVIRQEYSNYTGRAVLQPEGVIRKPDAPFMLASLDGYTEDGRVVEIKTSRSADNWGPDGSDEIPMEYLLQVQHYLAVTGFLVADVAVLIGGQDFRMYEIQADKELHTLLQEREAMFWERVEKQLPPEPVSQGDLTNYVKVQPGAVVATPEIADAVADLKKVRQQIEEIKAHEEVIKDRICMELADKDTLLDALGQPLATWKAVKPSKRLDTALLKTEAPEVYEKYLAEGQPTRRFLLK